MIQAEVFLASLGIGPLLRFGFLLEAFIGYHFGEVELVGLGC